jgi:hypothetical protein
MSIYKAKLTSAERRALKKHSHDLQDEIDVARLLIRRELAETADIEVICKAMETITKMVTARHRMAARPDEKAQQAFQAALFELDALEAGEDAEAAGGTREQARG